MIKKGILEIGRNALHSIDLFSLDVDFRENKQQRFTTWFGCALSILILTIVGYYGVIKFSLMTNYEDTRFQELDLINEDTPTFNGQDERNFPFSAFYIDVVPQNKEQHAREGYEQYVMGSLTKRQMYEYLSLDVYYTDRKGAHSEEQIIL